MFPVFKVNMNRFLHLKWRHTTVAELSRDANDSIMLKLEEGILLVSWWMATVVCFGKAEWKSYLLYKKLFKIINTIKKCQQIQTEKEVSS